MIISVKNVSFFYRVLNKKHNSIKGLFKDFIKGKISIENYMALDGIDFEVNIKNPGGGYVPIEW